MSVNFVRNNNVNTTVCTAFNDCQLSTDSLTLPIHFNYNTIINLNQFELFLTFIVLKNIHYDFIIGRPDIIRYDLWNRTLPDTLATSVPTVSLVRNEGVNNVILHNTLDKNNPLSRGDAPIRAARSQSSEDVPTNSPSSNKNWDERLSGISQTVQHDQHMRQASTESPQVSSHIVDPSEIVRAHTATLCPMDVEISSSVCGDSVNSGLCTCVEGTYTRHGTQNFSTQEVPFIDVNKTLIRERASLVTNDSQCNAASFVSEEEPGNQRINLHRSAGEEHLNREPKNGDDGYHGEHGAGLSSAEDWWLVTSSEQLHAFSGVSSLGGTVNSTSSPGTELGRVRPPLTGLI